MLLASVGCSLDPSKHTRYDVNTKYEVTDYHYIFISDSKKGGDLMIGEDGSGTLGYRTRGCRVYSPFAGGYFEPGTFDFPAVASMLHRTSFLEMPSGEGLSRYTVEMLVSEVTILPCWEWRHFRSRTRGPYKKRLVLYSADSDSIDRLFDTAIEAVRSSITKSKQRLEEREAGLRDYERLIKEE